VSKMPAKKRDESDVKKDVKTIFDQHGFFWWMPAGTMYSADNVDFNALKAGVFIAVETKWHDRPLTENQRAYLNSIRAENGFGFVVRDGTGKYDKMGTMWLKNFLLAFERSALAAQKGEKPIDEDGALMLNAIRALTEEL
jgi:hypothetical protein